MIRKNKIPTIQVTTIFNSNPGAVARGSSAVGNRKVRIPRPGGVEVGNDRHSVAAQALAARHTDHGTLPVETRMDRHIDLVAFWAAPRKDHRGSLAAETRMDRRGSAPEGDRKGLSAAVRSRARADNRTCIFSISFVLYLRTAVGQN